MKNVDGRTQEVEFAQCYQTLLQPDQSTNLQISPAGQCLSNNYGTLVEVSFSQCFAASKQSELAAVLEGLFVPDEDGNCYSNVRGVRTQVPFSRCLGSLPDLGNGLSFGNEGGCYSNIDGVRTEVDYSICYDTMMNDYVMPMIGCPPGTSPDTLDDCTSPPGRCYKTIGGVRQMQPAAQCFSAQVLDTLARSIHDDTYAALVERGGIPGSPGSPGGPSYNPPMRVDPVPSWYPSPEYSTIDPVTGFIVYTDPLTGEVSWYDPSTNTLYEANPDGTIQYWDEERGAWSVVNPITGERHYKNLSGGLLETNSRLNGLTPHGSNANLFITAMGVVFRFDGSKYIHANMLLNIEIIMHMDGRMTIRDLARGTTTYYDPDTKLYNYSDASTGNTYYSEPVTGLIRISYGEWGGERYLYGPTALFGEFMPNGRLKIVLADGNLYYIDVLTGALEKIFDSYTLDRSTFDRLM